MVTGLSLSLCVRDIMHGVYHLDYVDKIIAGTCALSEESWERLMQGYGERYWQADPERGRDICWQLLMSGKIDQPRVRGERGPDLRNGHWVSTPVPVDQVQVLKHKIAPRLAQVAEHLNKLVDLIE